ncbi:MAG: HAD family hydrolase [Pseudomonadales bacterium]|jgi:Cof subfamily protein (haloacid dehalogenase superfamily)
MPIKMIALDLDGTLAIENNQVLPATRDALIALHQSGVEVVIATGRRYRTTRYVIDNLGFDVYAVCNGGALVKKPDTGTLHEANFSTPQLNNIVEIARELNLATFGQRDAHDRGGPDFIIDDSVSWCSHTQKYYEDNKDWSRGGNLQDHDPQFLVSGTMGEEQQLRTLIDRIEASYPGTYEHFIMPWGNSDAFYCEITIAAIDKWYGLSKLASLFDIGANNICAVGDQINDIPMLSKVAHPVAMGNSVEALHVHANFICGKNDEDGILDVVDYINEHNSRVAS